MMIVTAAEIVEKLGYPEGSSIVRVWAAKETAGDDPFPKPLRKVGMTNLYDWEKVKSWYDRNFQ